MRIFFKVQSEFSVQSMTKNNFLIDNHYKTIYEQECIPVGCVTSAAVAVCWGRGSGWGVFGQGVWCLARRGCLPRGGCLPGGGVCPGGSARRGDICLGCTPPPMWTEFLTHACENITFPQLRLQTVISQKWVLFLQVVQMKLWSVSQIWLNI